MELFIMLILRTLFLKHFTSGAKENSSFNMYIMVYKITICMIGYGCNK